MPPKGFEGLSLEPDLATSSYVVSDTGNELALRAFLLQDGKLFHCGEHVSTISYADIDETKKRMVGKGSSGTVYYAVHARTGQPLAIKSINIGTKDHRDEIDRELSVLSAIKSENDHVLHIIGALWNPQECCIELVMEWMDFSLRNLTGYGGMPQECVQAVAYQVLKGCAYLHDVKRLIHRDIKPSNILINRDGNVKIGDFGISRVLGTVGMCTTYVGSQLYMAPERLDAGEYDVKSDVWSIGMTLVSCAIARNPWLREGDDPKQEITVFALFNRMRDGQLPSFPPSFGGDAADFLAKCLIRDPEQRWSCRQLLQHPYLSSCTEEATKSILSRFLQVFSTMIAASISQSKDLRSAGRSLADKRNRVEAGIAKLDALSQETRAGSTL